MFTGLISDCGEILEVKNLSAGKRFKIKTAYNVQTIEIGASIACNGICLTVVEKANENGLNSFIVEAWKEALDLTTIASWKAGDTINLERSLRMGDELGGHMVSGHVDGTVKIISIEEEGDARRFRFEVPQNLARFIMPKGSIALNGTSLTVNGVDKNVFDVLLIRHSLDVTTWKNRKIGDLVNVEIDQMARYVVRLIDHQMGLIKKEVE